MSAYTSAVSSAFRMQRTAIGQSRRMAELGVDAQTQFLRALRGSMDANEVAQRRSVELARWFAHASLDGMEAMVPRSDGTDFEDLRDAIDESFDSVLEGHAESFDVVGSAFDESLDDYEELTEETNEALEEFADALAEQNEMVEDRTIASIERVES